MNIKNILKNTTAYLLNLFLTPAGFYFLKDVQLFWIYVPLSILYGTFISILAFIFFYFFSGIVSLVLLVVFIVFWNVLLFYFTWKSTKREKPIGKSVFPRAFWFIPCMFLLIFISRMLITLFVGNQFAALKFTPFKVMTPNLMLGDYVFFTGIYDKDQIRRGDIITYKKDPNEAFGKEYVMRVIGLPGEKIAVRNENGPYGYVEKIFIDEKLVKQAFLQEVFDADQDASGQNAKYLYEENLSQIKYNILESEDYFNSNFMYVDIKLKEDEYYVMVDNRDRFSDSRNFGPIRKDQISGKFMFTVLSYKISEETSQECGETGSIICAIRRNLHNFFFEKFRWNYLGFDNR